jgi:hypothetical protein
MRETAAWAFAHPTYEISTGAGLLYVLAHQLGELEHRDRLFPAEDGLQRRIRMNLAFILGILQAMAFDVLPDFLGDLRARQWPLADEGGQLRAGPHGLLQALGPPGPCMPFPASFRFCRWFHGRVFLGSSHVGHPPVQRSQRHDMVDPYRATGMYHAEITRKTTEPPPNLISTERPYGECESDPSPVVSDVQFHEGRVSYRNIQHARRLDTTA